MKTLRRTLRVLLVLFLLLNVMAAIHAWKFTHFYNEPGKRRKKPDTMTFAEKMQGLVLGVNWPKSVITEVPGVPHANIYIKSTDDIQLQGWALKASRPKGTVILFHGYGGSRSQVVQEAGWFFEQGYNCLLPDLRAHGGSNGNTCTIGYDEADDVAAAFNYARSRGEKNIILWGTSLGAASIMHAIHRHKITPAKVILEMPFASLHDAVKARVRVMGLPAEPVASLLTFWGGLELGYWAFSHKPSEYARSIKCPVLLQWGVDDNRVSAQETEAIYESLPAANRRLVIYKNSAHQSLLRKEPVQWTLEVSKFLSR